MQRRTIVIFWAGLLLLLPSASTSLVAQDVISGKASKQTASENRRYSIETLPSTVSWKVNGVSQSSGKLLELVRARLVKNLSSKRFTLTQPLDSRCCTIQLALLKIDSDVDAAHLSKPFIVARLTLLDIDKQQVYAKEYRGQAKVYSKDSAAQLNSAADDLVVGMMGDEGLLKALTSN